MNKIKDFDVTKAFQELEMTESYPIYESVDKDSFNLSDEEDVAELDSYLDDNAKADPIDLVVDLDADSEEDLKDDYVGKAILRCSVCQRDSFKDLDGIERDEDETEELVNIGEDCVFCGSDAGFKLLGVVAPIPTVDLSIEEIIEEPKEEIEEEVVEESLDTTNVETTNESVEEQVTESKESLNEKEERFNRLKAAAKKIRERRAALDKADESVKEPLEEEKFAKLKALTKGLDKKEVKESKEEDLEVTSINEESFSDLANKYVHRVYENVDNYENTNCTIDGDKVILEGKINFKSGKSRDTKFIFEADSIRNGKLTFVGLNESFSSAKKAFRIAGKLVEGKLEPETLVYNYRAKLNESKDSTRVFGRVMTSLKKINESNEADPWGKDAIREDRHDKEGCKEEEKKIEECDKVEEAITNVEVTTDDGATSSIETFSDKVEAKDSGDELEVTFDKQEEETLDDEPVVDADKELEQEFGVKDEEPKEVDNSLEDEEDADGVIVDLEDAEAEIEEEQPKE